MKNKIDKGKKVRKKTFPFIGTSIRRRSLTNALNNISFENFKIFKTKNKFNFSDFNIILGNNGVGKSTIAELFKLLKQSQNSNIINTLITYKGDYKSWPSPYNLFFNRDNSSEIMLEFETSVGKPFAMMSRKNSELNKRIFQTQSVDTLLLLFKCLQLNTLEKWSIQDYLLKDRTLDIERLLLSVSDEISENDRIIGMDFRTQIFFDVYKDSNDSDHLGISCLKIFDAKTQNCLFEFMSRERIKKNKIFSKKSYIKSDAKSYIRYLKLVKALSEKYIQDIESQEHKHNANNDLILVSLCTSPGSKKLWNIIKIIINAYFQDINRNRGTNYQQYLYRELEEIVLLLKSVTAKKLMELCHSANYLKGISLLNAEESYLQRLGGSKSIFGFNEYSTSELLSMDTDPMNTIISIIFNYLNQREAPGVNFRIKQAFFKDIFKPINNFLRSSIFIKSTNYIDQTNYEPNISPPDPFKIAFEEQWSPEMIVTYLFHNKDKIAIINKWLPKLGLDFKIEMVRITNKSELPMVRINAFDNRTKTNSIDLQDLGLGAATALRIVLIILCTKKKNIFLTEPEQNLHPKVHINFVNLIEHSIRENENTFFVETHSENLTLKLFQLIRNKKFNHKQISINVVTKSNRGGKIKKIEVDENGDQISSWPGGFFAEKYDLV